jgi:hypothetical protein
MGELRGFGQLVGAVRDTLGIAPERLVQQGLTLDQQVARLGDWLERLIAAHARQDWLALADILELDLEPLLRGWGLTLLACLTQETAGSPA